MSDNTRSGEQCSSSTQSQPQVKNRRQILEGIVKTSVYATPVATLLLTRDASAHRRGGWGVTGTGTGEHDYDHEKPWRKKWKSKKKKKWKQH